MEFLVFSNFSGNLAIETQLFLKFAYAFFQIKSFLSVFFLTTILAHFIQQFSQEKPIHKIEAKFMPNSNQKLILRCLYARLVEITLKVP